MVKSGSNEKRIVGEFNHYEGAVALTHGLPVLLVAEDGVDNRGVLWTGAGRTTTFVPNDADGTWLESNEFKECFGAWCREVQARNDVFLGYCSKSSGVAAQIQLRLERHGDRF